MLKKVLKVKGAILHSSQFWKMCTFHNLRAIVHLPIILPFSSVIEIPTGTGISQSFPLKPFSALTLQKNKAKLK